MGCGSSRLEREELQEICTQYWSVEKILEAQRRPEHRSLCSGGLHIVWRAYPGNQQCICCVMAEMGKFALTAVKVVKL
eukprot:3141328-Rhodomonas_salina.1